LLVLLLLFSSDTFKMCDGSLASETQQPPKRQLGFPVYLSNDDSSHVVATNNLCRNSTSALPDLSTKDIPKDISILSLSDAALDAQIKSLLWQHGVICVKGQNLTSTEMLYLAERFGETFVLPKGFGVKCSEQPGVIRIGNVREDGTVISHHTAAEHWHHDGSFRARPQHALINFLHTKIKPDVGGKTGFLDLTGAYHATNNNRVFSEAVKGKLRHSSIVVEPIEIDADQRRDKIKDEKARQDKIKWDRGEVDNDFVEADSIDKYLAAVEHRVISPHPVTRMPVMYLPENGKGVLDRKTHEHWISADKLWEAVRRREPLINAEFGYEEDLVHDNDDASEENSSGEKASFFYEHQWEEGDLLIWDNTQLMHRSMGGFCDQPRLLYRAQAIYQGSFC